MSHIPNSAMPHAGHVETAEDQNGGTTATLTRTANGIADKVRANPKPAIAAGAAILAGAVAAAAIPFIGRNWKSDEKKTTAKKSGGAKAKKTTAKA